jgi:hypothetical protein
LVENSRTKLNKTYKFWLFGVVIGYSFSDTYINSIIVEAVKINNLELFIIDPNGLDVIKNKFLNQPEQDTIKSAVIGIPKCPLEETFKDANSVEYSKINRFLNDLICFLKLYTKSKSRLYYLLPHDSRFNVQHFSLFSRCSLYYNLLHKLIVY